VTLLGRWLVALALSQAGQPLFERYKEQVVQVRVLERSSGTKAAIGSGFYAGAGGEILTNYHVISSLVVHPERYTAELVAARGANLPAEIVAVDVVHDLAVLKSKGAPPPAPFQLASELPPQGARLFSFGNPHDLGNAIVEGTFNGTVRDTLYDRLHFTGAINSGMSGGPSIEEDGEVAGINVATSGNGVGFLVPVRFAQELLGAAAHLPAGGAPLLAQVRSQLMDNQQRIASQLLSTPIPAQELDGHRVPGRWAEWLRCWADSEREESTPYLFTHYSCTMEESVFVSQSQRTGLVRYGHYALRSDELNAFQFSALAAHTFAQIPDWLRPEAGESDATNFECQTSDTRLQGTPYRVAFCLRAYRKLNGLYDAVVSAASLQEPRSALQTNLTLSGFTYDNAVALTRRYLEAFAWKP
jgi:serine protease Do